MRRLLLTIERALLLQCHELLLVRPLLVDLTPANWRQLMRDWWPDYPRVPSLARHGSSRRSQTARPSAWPAGSADAHLNRIDYASDTPPGG